MTSNTSTKASADSLTTDKPVANHAETASLILSRINKKASVEANEDYKIAWNDVLACAGESIDSFESLHDFYRLLDVNALEDTKNPWYLSRDIVGEALTASSCSATPGTLGDPCP